MIFRIGRRVVAVAPASFVRCLYMDARTRPLESGEVARLLRSLSTAMLGELRDLPDEIVAWHPAPGEWCVKECIGHIVEADRRSFSGRIRTILASPGLTFVEWDQSAVARARDDCHRPADELQAELRSLREDSRALVEGLTAADLELGGTHPQVGFLHVRDLLHEWVHHDRNHFRQMLANVQAYVWPAMANTRRFSQP